MSQPIFCVSDLHMGDCGPRDNFAGMNHGMREKEFLRFLDYVERRNGELIIAGDLFELWQGNISKVITCRKSLLDRLAAMGAKYMLGNHDIDLLHFKERNGIRLDHPLFRDLHTEREIVVNGRHILLIHGHEQDVYCRDESPGIGRISAIYSGLREDRNGGPLSKWKYGGATVEARSLGHWDRFSRFCRRLVGQPNATMVMRREILETYKDRDVDALIYGHTHEPGQFYRFSNVVGQYIDLPIYNTGTWAESVNTFAEIDSKGEVRLFDWTMGGAVRNTDRLYVDR